MPTTGAKAKAAKPTDKAYLDKAETKEWFLGHAPCGQRQVSDSDLAKLDKGEHSKLKSDWPRTIVSFEAWCASTLYDPQQAYDSAHPGGKRFQQLMHWCLGGDEIDNSLSSGYEDFERLSDSYYPNKDWQSGEVAILQPGRKKDIFMHISRESGHYKSAKDRPGGGTMRVHSGGGGGGYCTFLKSSWKTAGEKDYCERMAATTVGAAGQPCGLFDWVASTGHRMDFGVKMGQNANASSQMFGDLKDPKATNQVIQSPYLGMNAAAIFGLYFYPGCDKPINNWVVEVKYRHVDKLKIRMRRPNPNYILRGETLRIKEPVGKEESGMPTHEKKALEKLRKYAKEAWAEGTILDASGELPDYVCGDDGWVMRPLLGKGVKPPYAHTTLLQRPNKDTDARGAVPGAVDALANVPLTLVTPVVHNLTIKQGPKPKIVMAGKKDNPNVVQRCKNMQDLFGAQFVHRTTTSGGATLCFGFAMPAALWLYPNYPLLGQSGHKVVPIKGKHASQSDLQAQNLNVYQPFPNIRPEVRNGVKWSEFRNLWDILDKPVQAVPEDRQRHVLEKTFSGGKQETIVETSMEREDAWKEVAAAASSGVAATSVEDASGPFQEVADGLDDDEVPVDEDEEAEVAGAGERAEELRELLNEDQRPAAREQEDDQERPEDRTEFDTTEAHTGTKEIATVHLDWDPPRGVEENFATRQENALYQGQGVKAANDVVKKLPKPLNPGSLHKPNESQYNGHWHDSAQQPWPHSAIYEGARANFEYEGDDDPLSDATVEWYKDRYGNVSNLFLHGDGQNARRVVDVNGSLGLAKSLRTNPKKLEYVLQLPLTFYQKPEDYGYSWEQDGAFLQKARYSMFRILAVYYEEKDLYQCRSNTDETPGSQKRRGMVQGLWYTSSGQYDLPQPWKRVGNSGKNMKLAVPKVFESEPPAEYAEHFKALGPSTNSESLGLTLKDLSSKWVAYANSGVKSKMTVRQWVESPWSYEYLPYQAQFAFFQDGETFSEGCNRCARPFYEYEKEFHSFSLDLGGVKGTQHYPMLYWQVTKSGARGNAAPLPFHDPVFWSEEHTLPKRGGKTVKPPSDSDPKRQANVPEQDLEGMGLQQWTTREFPLKTAAVLKQEYQNRQQPPTQVIKQKAPLVFRETNGAMYDSSRLVVQHCNEQSCTQGRMSRGVPKVKFGMYDYHLQRATRYTNCCKDCAAVLDFAPGLYKRNSRLVVTGRFRQIDPVTGQRIAREDLDTFWLNSSAWTVQPRKRDGTLMPARKFDQRFLSPSPKVKQDLRRELAVADPDYDAMHAAHMESLSAHLKATNCSVMTDDSLTKLTDVDVHVQHVFLPRRQGKEAAKAIIESENNKRNQQVKGTMAFLNRIIDELKRDATAPPQVMQITAKDRENRTLINTLHAIRYRLAEVDARVPDPKAHLKKFDPNFRRVEHRDEEVPYEGKQYRNSLRIVTFQPRKGAMPQKQKDAETGQTVGVKSWEPKDYVELVYLYDKATNKVGPVVQRRQEIGRAQKPWEVLGDAHSWRGDEFVLDGKRFLRANKTSELSGNFLAAQPRQVREMKQSRFFVTYSLHRAVTTEDEALLIMEKMGDAVRVIFGNDRALCELLIFGKKLATTTPDSISTKYFEVITRANKIEKDFYGHPNAGTSYIHDRYDTHVDSIDVDCGVELGPNLHHPHFHCILTVNHFGYVQFDTFRFKVMLERLFKGIRGTEDDDLHDGTPYVLRDAGGLPFYGDNENPYVDIRLWPTDNWQDVIAGYVRKSATPSIMQNLRQRAGMG